MKKIRRVLLIILVSLLVLVVASKIFMLKNLEKSMIFKLPEKESPLDSLLFKNSFINLSNRVLTTSFLQAEKSSPAFFICTGNGEILFEWKPVQVFLADKGYSSFVFSYSGFGNSTGKATVANLNKDVLAAYNKFVELTPDTENRIAVSHSLGGGPLNKMAKKLDPPPSQIFVHAAFSSIRDVLVDMGMFSKGTVWLFPDIWNSKKSIRKLDIPIYLLHSKADSTISFINSQRLEESSNLKAKLIVFEELEHNSIYQDDREIVWTKILENIDKQ